MSIRNDKLILVCSECLTASCWYGEFMCWGSRDAKTVVKPVGELRDLNREHPDNWTAAKFTSVYGTSHPDFTCDAVTADRVTEGLAS